MVLMLMTASVAGNGHNILNAHPGCKERNSQKETDNEHGNQHDNPRNGVELTITESLERASSDDTDKEPHKNRVPVAGDRVIQEAGN
jgi:hypothetical protein